MSFFSSFSSFFLNYGCKSTNKFCNIKKYPYFCGNMAKDKIAYVCSNCGQESQKWVGKCPSCGQWNTFKEIRIANDTGSMAAHAAATSLNNERNGSRNKPQKLCDISTKDEPRMDMHD